MGALYVVLNLTQHKKIFISRWSVAPKKKVKTHSSPEKFTLCARVLHLGEITHRKGFTEQVTGRFILLHPHREEQSSVCHSTEGTLRVGKYVGDV